MSKVVIDSAVLEEAKQNLLAHGYKSCLSALVLSELNSQHLLNGSATNKQLAEEFSRGHKNGVKMVQAARKASPLEGKYGNVLTPFVKQMEQELKANAYKGDRPGWLKMTPDQALLEIYWHISKLQRAVRDNDIAGILEHSADVANMAMMLADVCGVLATLEEA